MQKQKSAVASAILIATLRKPSATLRLPLVRMSSAMLPTNQRIEPLRREWSP